MKLFFNIFKWFFISIAGILLLGFLYVYFIFLAKPGEVSSANELNDGDWHTVLLDGETSCSDGSEYYIFTRKGNSDNLIIHFAGGGSCWDNITCFTPITWSKIFSNRDSKDLVAFYLPDISKLIPNVLDGIFNIGTESNPFKDWNIVLIPYCSADLHVGNTTKTYNLNNKNLQLHHNGRKNTMAAVRWISENFKGQNKILVSGESAGAYASAFWTPFITTQVESQKIYQLSDGALLSSNRWSEIMDSVWRSESQSFLKFEIEKDVYENALLNRKDSIHKPIKHLHSNTVYDLILPKFSAALNHIPTATNEYIDNWSEDMLISMKKLSNSNLDYQYFISNCEYDSLKHATPHTIMINSRYNVCSSNQITYMEWLKRNVINDEPTSVGSQFFK